MANIPGNVVQPGVYSNTTTGISGGIAVAGGSRLACIIGEGARSEVIVASALGNGNDGVSPTNWRGTTGRDGRHFSLQLYPIISNRLQLFKNGIPLLGIEEVPDDNAFSSKYDYRVDISTGHIELQAASLVDQGGKLYSTGSTNVGLGNLDGYTGPQLVDSGAPPENWTVKCIAVQRNSSGQVLPGTAKFLALGSVSGNQVDANGNPVTWMSNGQLVSNGIISFAINESQASGSAISPFVPGDFFTIRVKSGTLVRNDTLTASYIHTLDINDPELFDNMQTLSAKHGAVSVDNTLSLGASLAFANASPAILALQAAPAMPRRTSYQLSESFHATSTDVNDFILPLPLGVFPNADSEINFFVTDPVTKVERQILPNKYPFYTIGESGKPTATQFAMSDTYAPAGYDFCYSVIEGAASETYGTDGYLNRSLSSNTIATFSVEDKTFDLSLVGKTLKIFDSSNPSNDGQFPIVNVSNGSLQIQAPGSTPFATFVNASNVSFHVINPVNGSTVASSTGTDGSLVAIPSSSTATLQSASVNFAGLSAITGLKLVITSGNAANKGTFDISSIDGSGVITIAKSFVSEDNIEYEIIDNNDTSAYVVVNHNMVSQGEALRVSLIDRRDSSFYDAGWTNALETLEAFEVDIVVPLPRQTISVIFQNALNHCIAQSNIRNKHERVLFTGAIRGLTPDNLTGTRPAAVENIGILEGIQGDNIAEVLEGNTEDLQNYSVPDSFGFTFRSTYFYPDEIIVQVGSDSQKVDGFYMAAAAAGYMSGLANLAMPLTNKILSGFNIGRDKLLKPSQIDALLSNGVAVVQPVAGGGKVIWGKTTTESGFAEEEELSIVFIRDRISKAFRAGMGGFVGLPEDPDTVQIATAKVSSIINGFISQRLITDYSSLVVKYDDFDPRQLNVTCKVRPTYAINWVYIQTSVGATV